MKKATGIEKLILDAQKKYDQAVETDDFITANTYKGYLRGLHTFASCIGSLNNFESATKQELKIAIKKEEWGQAAYLKAWLSGWNMASQTHELQVLKA